MKTAIYMVLLCGFCAPVQVYMYSFVRMYAAMRTLIK